MFCSIQVTGPVLQELLGSWTQLETLHATFVSAPFDVTDLSKLKELKEVKLKASAGSNIQVQNYRKLLDRCHTTNIFCNLSYIFACSGHFQTAAAVQPGAQADPGVSAWA